MPIPILGALGAVAIKVTPALLFAAAAVLRGAGDAGKGIGKAGEGIAKVIDAKNRNKDRK